MKIISFSSGLGNQIFQYSFYLYLKENHPNTSIYGYYNKKWLTRHNGLEIQNVFNIDLPKSNIWITYLVYYIRILRKLFKTNQISCNDDNFNSNAIFFDGWWQNNKYFTNRLNDIKFREFLLSDKNINVLHQIKNTESISIHVRRGDYLSPAVINLYGNICTLDYYKNAINIVSNRSINPHFFIFSDDTEWARQNIKIPNATYITWNQDKNSYLDMYLMSYCKINIISNSTFSYWAAMFNINKTSFVIYPQKWVNYPVEPPVIFPKYWYPL